MGNKSSANLKSPKHCKWISLKSTPFGHFPSVVAMDSKKFLTVALNNSSFKSDGIYTYIISQNRWIKSINYDKDSWFSSIAAAFNEKTNELYIFEFICNNLVIINFTTFTWTLINFPYLSYCDGAKCIIINNELHLIGGKRNNKHLVWKHNAKQLEQIHVFNELKVGFKSHELVYIESKQLLYMFGGESHQHPLDTIYQYSIVKGEWSISKVKMPRKLHRFGLIYTKYWNVCVLFGGIKYDENGYTFSKDIFIFDVETQLFSQSIIQCPMPCMCEVILYDNYPYSEMLITCGYIRNLRNINNCYPFVPHDIISFIACMFILQYVHLIDVTDGYHWKINLDEILNNAQLINVTNSTRQVLPNLTNGTRQLIYVTNLLKEDQKSQ
eukprot:447594_1